MIKGVKVLGRSGKNGRVTHFEYQKHEGWWLTEKFEKATKQDFDNYIKDCIAFGEELEESKKNIAAQRAAMAPEERERQDEADRVIFERWQDEANTNLYLAGVVDENEDTDFNPFRKDNE